MKLRYALAAAIAIFGVALLFSAVAQLPDGIGEHDFVAYWSASHLLSQGRNFADEANLLEIETEHAGWTADYALKTWNPPWVFSWLLPLAQVSFHRAASLWLVVNFLLLFFGVTLIWHLYSSKADGRYSLLILLLVAALFPATILVLIYGQMALLVLASLAGFSALYRESRDTAAGAALSFSMVKPHLVFVTVPLLLLVSIRERRWRVVLGFCLVLVISSLVVLVLRPESIEDYRTSTTSDALLKWVNPTVPALLYSATGQLWLRLVGIILLPAAIFLWYSRKGHIALSDLVDMSLLASVIAAPFAWSYDFAVLLLPILRVVLWVVEGKISRLESVLVGAVVVTVYIVNYCLRMLSPSEEFYFWIPLVIAGLYLWVWLRAKSKLGLSSETRCTGQKGLYDSINSQSSKGFVP